MLSGISSDITRIALAIVGIAITVTIVTSNNTADIIKAITGGFSNSISAAMGSQSVTTRAL